MAPTLIKDNLWSAPPEILAISSDEVHVWRAAPNLATTEMQGLLRILAPDEISRARGLRFESARKNYIISRAILRLILGRYLNADPSLLQLHYNSHGKPSLVDDFKLDSPRFNLAHSHELVLYAVTCGREVGVDIEYIRPKVATQEIARRFFSPREVEDLRKLAPNMRADGFYNCWTRKEAYLKAEGERTLGCA